MILRASPKWLQLIPRAHECLYKLSWQSIQWLLRHFRLDYTGRHCHPYSHKAGTAENGDFPMSALTECPQSKGLFFLFPFFWFRWCKYTSPPPPFFFWQLEQPHTHLFMHEKKTHTHTHTHTWSLHLTHWESHWHLSISFTHNIVTADEGCLPQRWSRLTNI